MVTVTATISPVVTVMGEAVVPTVTAVEVRAPRTWTSTAVEVPGEVAVQDNGALSSVRN